MARQSRQTVPIRIGESIELSITGLTNNGEGVGKYQGFTVFVPGALPGDRVLAEVISMKKTYGRALIKSVVDPSPERIAPTCPVFGECGACQLQHLGYQASLSYKRQWVVDALERIGKLSGVTVHPTLPMENPWRYRNKAQFPVALDGERLIAGCFRQRSHQVIDLDDCLIQHSISNRLLQTVKQLTVEFGLPPYDEITGEGLLRHVLIRVGFRSGEALAVLVTTAAPFPARQEMAQELMQQVPELVGVVQNINPRRTNVILGEKMVLLAGRDYLIDELGGLKFRISAGSFFQVNPLQTEVLYQTALDYAALTGQETVIDAYCGIGSISLFLAQAAKEVIGVEVVAAAVRDAQASAELNGIRNARFITGEAEQVIPFLYQTTGTRADVIVVDPPRSGCDEELLTTIARMQPQRVVYVSCNPSTLARDLAYLSQQGFQVQEVQPVDMFPQTVHVECVTLMSRL